MRRMLVGLGLVLCACIAQAASTQLVRDIAPGAASSGVHHMMAFGTEVWFGADDGSGHGDEPWRSDGTETGTVMAADLQPGPEDSSIWNHAVVSGRLLLWAIVSPTSAGLFSVANPGAAPTLLLPRALDGVLPAVLGDRLIFTGAAPETGIELYATDGTAAGTVRLSDTAEGPRDGAPMELRAAGGRVYFSAITSVGGAFLGREPWSTDGTPVGTTLARDLLPGPDSSAPAGLRAMGDRIYFGTNDPANTCDVWRSDGTPAGTVMIASRCIGALGKIGDQVILHGSADDGSYGRFVWRSDGTPEGTVPVAPLGEYVVIPGFPVASGGSSAVVGNRLVTDARDSAHGRELWVTDGTAAGTSLLLDVEPGPGHSSPAIRATTGTIAFFVATTTASGTQLWRTDGTPAGTFRLTDRVAPTPVNDFGVARLVSPNSRGWLLVGDTLFFVMDDVAWGAELWRTDGTVAGTVRVTDINPGPGDSFEPGLEAALGGGRLFVAASAPAVGREPWVIDGILPPLTDARLRLAKLDTPPGDEVVALDARVRVHAEPAIDPLANGVRVRIGQPGAGAHDVLVPGGAFDRVTKRGWKAAGNGRSWSYRGDGSIAGVRKVTVSGDGTGRYRIKLTAKGADWTVDASQAVLVTIMLDAPHGNRGQAGETAFAPSSCTFSGRKLACR